MRTITLQNSTQGQQGYTTKGQIIKTTILLFLQQINSIPVSECIQPPERKKDF